jgi:predicted DNA-binding transcriptional regulator AlpA/biotin operon repressor
MDRLLTAEELGRRLSVHPTQLLRWVEEGRMPPPVLLPDRIPRWWWSTIVQWVDSLPAGGSKVDSLPAEPKTDRQPAKRQPADLPPLAQAILHVLRQHDGCWITGQEIAAEIGDVDRYSGTFNRAIRVLRECGLIESHSSYGYRYVPESTCQRGGAVTR